MEKLPRNPEEARKLAKSVAEELAFKLKIPDDARPEIGIVLGTGWSESINLANARSCPLSELEGFDALEGLYGSKGHPRCFEYGIMAGRPVLILRGRIHLHESYGNSAVGLMNRLTTEIFMQFTRTLILTCAVGSLRRKRFPVGSVCLVDGFLTLFSPQMPQFGFEFVSPEDKLSANLRRIARKQDGLNGDRLPARKGKHAMVCGPFFEGRKVDKGVLRNCGADVVGMSVLPEVCVAAAYEDSELLVLCFVTNTATEEHSDDENRRRLKASSDRLGPYLERVVENAPLSVMV